MDTKCPGCSNIDAHCEDAEEQKTKDIKKTQVALLFGYDIYRVKESDYKKK